MALGAELGDLRRLLRQAWYAVSAPEWPRKKGDVEELRATADESRGLGVKEIVDYYEARPASLSKAQYKKYEKSPAKTDYLEFEGRPHLHMTAPGWEEIAAAIGGWLDGVLDGSKTARV